MNNILNKLKYVSVKVAELHANQNCTSVQFGCATAHRCGREIGGYEEREDVGVTCVNVVANVVLRLPSVLWHLLLLWSAHQARIKCNMNVSVATVFVVVVAIVVAAVAHKLRLVLCLCRRAYVAVVPSACLPAASAVPVSLFSTLYAKALLHNAKAMAMAMAMTKRCKCCQPKVKGSIKRALQCGCNAEAVKILLSRFSSVCI